MKENTSRFKPNKLAALAFALLALQGSALAKDISGFKKHCEQHFTNTNICFFANSDYEDQGKSPYMVDAKRKTMMMGVVGTMSQRGKAGIDDLLDAEKELSNKKALNYEGFSYCEAVEPYILSVLAQLGAINGNLQSRLAEVCGN